MRGLSLTQPWATLVALGHKHMETRSWPTAYRGWIAIHAALTYPKDARLFAARHRDLLPADLPRGAILAVVWLNQCLPTSVANPSDFERQFGNFEPNRFAWVFRERHALMTPIPCRGALSLWSVPVDVETQIRQQVGPFTDPAALFT